MASCISKVSTMKEILDEYPSAQRTLHKEYHIGGCTKCGFDMDETLEAVLLERNITDIDTVIGKIKSAEETLKDMTISTAEVSESIQKGKELRLLDVRDTEEWSVSRLEGAQLLTRDLVSEIVNEWDKDTPIVLFCHTGNRSLEAAGYLMEHGFTNIKSMDGGIEEWSLKIDSSIPRYKVDQFMGVVTV